MSRLAKKPIALPQGVEVKRDNETLFVKGPKGQLQTFVPNGIELKTVEGEGIYVELDENSGLAQPKHGLYRSLIGNAVEGVSNGFEKKLQLIGVGYRAAVKGNVLDLQLGFSHPSEVPIPEGVSVVVEKNTSVTVTGADKQRVGQFAADVRSLKPPEPYKGKGIRYVDEFVRKKAGKAAKGK
ncbi:MAG: 50S ribosomal protein L6 [Simkaniaceae bacterium]|nr:50S ribosomal protein L6 [Simkaniaceae bacterium]